MHRKRQAFEELIFELSFDLIEQRVALNFRHHLARSLIEKTPQLAKVEKCSCRAGQTFLDIS
jgi:hypothetical protein